MTMVFRPRFWCSGGMSRPVCAYDLSGRTWASASVQVAVSDTTGSSVIDTILRSISRRSPERAFPHVVRKIII